jgi:predicted glutamine amidotransferase
MCIICIKKKGVQFPTIQQVKTMCDNNSHGFSMVIHGGGKDAPMIYRTLNKEKFLTQYRKILSNYDYKSTTMYIHARIKTHGTQRIENCHGWKENGLIFAHNGILQIDNRDDLTDSETFFRDIFSPAYRVGGWQMGDKTINAIIGTSKFVFMDNNGNIKHYGHYIEDDGLLFSNSSYISYSQRLAQRTTSFYPTRYTYLDKLEGDWDINF